MSPVAGSSAAGDGAVAAASSATVVLAKMSTGLKWRPACAARAATCRLRIESPPNSKKLSWMPTRSIPRTWLQISARVFSAGVRGAA
jgi:hypothetical protein